MAELDRQALEEMRRDARQALVWAREAGSRWADDAKTVAAVAHMIEQLGEISRRVTLATKGLHAGIPWAAMAGLRNRIYHGYGSLDIAVLRETVPRDLPALVRELDAALRTRSR